VAVARAPAADCCVSCTKLYHYTTPKPLDCISASVSRWRCAMDTIPDAGEETGQDQPLASPRASPAASQTRRLRLRNAGFRGPSVPSRKVTPNSSSTGTTSTNWSTASGIISGSDVENMSPGGARSEPGKMEKRRRSSGILQEISNTGPLTRSKPGPPKLSSARVLEANASDYVGAYPEGPASPPPPKSMIRAKSAKTRAKIGAKRRSVSGETRMYIEHLEAELAIAQAQLSAINSPSVTREQSSKMRSLTAESKQLQEEVAGWEAKFEQRVQEEVDRHHEIEAGLMKQIRQLQGDVDEAKFRIEELEGQVENATRDVEVAEAANVNLEKRIEIMSDILAASPAKIDLHAHTPGMPSRKHPRPKSMLPRFPTASSLVTSPVRPLQTQPTSPLFRFAGPGDGTIETRLTLDTNVSPSDLVSDAESVFSAAPVDGDSMTSLEQGDIHTSFNNWTMHAVQIAKARPARRMRRFGAGCLGPKPLILPSTTGYEQVPASAPPLERGETVPGFPFNTAEHELPEEEESPSAQLVRRRASTTADQATLAKLTGSSSFLLPPQRLEISEEGLESMQCPASTESHGTNRKDFSSIGSAAGRNLMEELSAVRTNGSYLSSDERTPDEQEASPPNYLPEEAVMVYGRELEVGSDVHSILSASDDESPSQALIIAVSSPPRESGHRREDTARPKRPVLHSLSMLDRLAYFFSDLWHSPVVLARHLVHTAQARMCLPGPLRNVQWWLVSVLFGPMARRKWLEENSRGSNCCASNSPSDNHRSREDSPLLHSDDDGLAYGTRPSTPIPPTSSSSSANTSRPGTISGKGKKRIHTVGANRTACPHHHPKNRSCGDIFRRHSPWMWLKFSITLAFAVGVAFKDGPAALLKTTACSCKTPAAAGPEEGANGKKNQAGFDERVTSDSNSATAGAER
jgi:hypothetical protein